MLVVPADGVSGRAQILSGVCEEDVLQGERGHPGMAAYHNISIKALQRRGKKSLVSLVKMHIYDDVCSSES